MPLSPKQQAFVEFYLTNWNGSEAARRAGYSEKTAKEQASRMLTNVNVQAAIKARLAELTMGADEVLIRLSDHARGDMSDFLTITEEDVVIDQHINGVLVRTETVRRPVASFDLTKAAAAGKLHLIKTYSRTDKGLRAELYDAHAALALLGKHHRLFMDRTEHTGADGAPLFPDFERALEKTYAADDPPSETADRD